MKTKKVDATLGAFWNYEGVQLRRRSTTRRSSAMENVGVPTYEELVIVARQQDLAKGGERVRRFMRALGQGTRRCAQTPRPGSSRCWRPTPTSTATCSSRASRRPCPVFFPAAGKPFGWMEPRRVGAYGDWMYTNKLLSRPPDAARALTDEFLPGQGLADTARASAIRPRANRSPERRSRRYGPRS